MEGTIDLMLPRSMPIRVGSHHLRCGHLPGKEQKASPSKDSEGDESEAADKPGKKQKIGEGRASERASEGDQHVHSIVMLQLSPKQMNGLRSERVSWSVFFDDCWK